MEVDEWVLYEWADPTIDRYPAEPEPWFIVDMADAPVMDVGGDEDRPRIEEEDGGAPVAPAGPPAKVAGPLPAPAGAPGVPVPGEDQAAAAAGLANMHAAAAAAAAQAAANAKAKAPAGVLPKAGIPQQILGVDVNAIVAALLAAQGAGWQPGGAPPPAATSKMKLTDAAWDLTWTCPLPFKSKP